MSRGPSSHGLVALRRRPAIISICAVLALFALSTFSLPFAFGFTNEQSAAAEVGQPNFTTGGCDDGTQPVPSDTTLCFPYASAFDSAGNLWVADTSNQRYVEFPLSGGTIQSTESSVIGQTSFTAYLGNEGGSPSASTDRLPFGLAFDSQGDLWAADTVNNRILEFPLVSGAIQTTATKVIGQTSFSAVGCNEFSFSSLSTLCQPEGLTFDSSGNLWVADFDNSRVLEFPLVGGVIQTTATTLIGQTSAANGSGSPACNEAGTGPPAAPTSSTLCGPTTLAFDPEGNLWVADQSNNRVLEFPLVSGVIQPTATKVIGQVGYTENQANEGGSPMAGTLSQAYGIAFDPEGNLWVSDTINNRILQFPVVGGVVQTTANVVLGESTFTSGLGNAGQSPSVVSYGFNHPQGITFDPSGNLWVTDFNNGRILEFTGPGLPGGCTAVIAPPPTDGATTTAQDSCTGTPTGGSFAADATGTGITVSIMSTTGTGPVTITASDLGAVPSVGPDPNVAGGGAAYYDVHIAGIGDGTAYVCIASASNTLMDYWDGSGWTSVSGLTISTNTIGGRTVCGDISVAALDGTPIVTGSPSGSSTGVPQFPLGNASGFLLLVVLLPVLLAIGRARRTRSDAR